MCNEIPPRLDQKQDKKEEQRLEKEAEIHTEKNDFNELFKRYSVFVFLVGLKSFVIWRSNFQRKIFWRSYQLEYLQCLFRGHVCVAFLKMII